PEGSWIAAPMVGALTYTIPECSSLMVRKALRRSLVYTLRLSPYWVELAAASASSSDPTGITTVVGPKISSWATRMVADTSPSTVRLDSQPPASPARRACCRPLGGD